MITMTYELAMAAGKDAANLRMRKAGRTVWNRADYNESVRTFNRFWSIEDSIATASTIERTPRVSIDTVRQKAKKAL
jgi:hypothetical protein